MLQCDTATYQLDDNNGCSNKTHRKAPSIIEDTETKIYGKVKIEIKSRTDLLSMYKLDHPLRIPSSE